jgi:phage terminase small subunit
MPELTDQQQAFVLHYVSGDGSAGNAAESARRAGYSAATAREQGHQLLHKPHVKAAIDEECRRRLSGPLSVKAIGVLEAVLDNPNAAERVKVDAAKAVLDRAGFVAPRAPDHELAKPKQRTGIADYNLVELEEMVADMHAGWRAEKVAGNA